MLESRDGQRAHVSERGALPLLDAIRDGNARISVIGSMNADYTVVASRLPKPGETINGGPLQLLPGGKSANQAAASARLGAHVNMFGAVGDDSNAKFLLGHLQDAGVDVSHVLHLSGASGTTVITVDEHGENTIVYSAGSNAKVSVEYVHESQKELTSAPVLGLCLESPMKTVCECARICHEAGMQVLLNDSPFVDHLPDELIKHADILLVNEHEMAQLLHIDEPDNDDWLGIDWSEVARQMQRFGFERAVVTLGADGCMVLDQGHATQVDAVTIDAVDTTGCGDAFMGTLLAGLSVGLELVDCARLGSYVSGYAATGVGAQASYGTAEQIQERFQTQ
ncbi:ribokinase [Bifidobacterium sp. ESL0775]|uniref:ribokinase n=1 Tax=Bifidobacterium sp. ESL0775 TaxID=2983230 RepID=UPI0023F74B9D|nr:ribokinase [Bifidobacterium sp. ESL0775]WEV69229.1 ribokinase [Bifidobacterium sp. ESL0775]